MLRLAICLGVLVVASGCGGGGPKSPPLPATSPVKGAVTLDGKPLSQASVKFIPTGQTKGVECYGITDDSGSYELIQLRGASGAPPGDYMVVISRFAKPDGSPLPVGPDAPPPANVGAVESLPPQYSSFTGSKLKAQVPMGGGEFKFALKSK